MKGHEIFFFLGSLSPSLELSLLESPLPHSNLKKLDLTFRSCSAFKKLCRAEVKVNAVIILTFVCFCLYGICDQVETRSM